MKDASNMVRPVELVRRLIEASLDRNPSLPLSVIGDVILGCMLHTHERGSDIAKIAVQAVGFPETVGDVTLNWFRASCAEAVVCSGTGNAFWAEEWSLWVIGR